MLLSILGTFCPYKSYDFRLRATQLSYCFILSTDSCRSVHSRSRVNHGRSNARHRLHTTAKAANTPCLNISTPQLVTADAAVVHYADLRLDRAAHLRHDTQHLSQLLQAANSQLLLLSKGQNLVNPTSLPSKNGDSSSSAVDSDPQGNPARWTPTVVQPAGTALQYINNKVGTVFLGLAEDGTAVFAAELSDDVDFQTVKQQLSLPATVQWVKLRSEGPYLSASDAALLAYARGLLEWHSQNLYCSRTGQPTMPASGGHSRSTDGGPRSATYPRLDPAIIVLVQHGDWALLGRKAAWKTGRWSCLAGFVEVGETLEQAVVREVQEESGVAVQPEGISYHSSQPWPFPRSLMIGFVAAAKANNTPQVDVSRGLEWLPETGRWAAQDVGISAEEVDAVLQSFSQLPAVNPDEQEIEDARWFHVAFLRHTVMAGLPVAGHPSFFIPQEYALANRIITSWLHTKMQQSGEWAGAAVPEVAIDSGTFKYVLLRIRDEQGRSKLLVRGDAGAAYHNHIYGQARQELHKLGLQVDVCGGGRMEHHPEQGVLNIYGYSSAYGQAPHDLTVHIVRTFYPLYHPNAFVVSYDGY